MTNHVAYNSIILSSKCYIFLICLIEMGIVNIEYLYLKVNLH